MAFAKGDPNINRAGRKQTLAAEKPTNRSLREKALLEMVRKFKPHQAKAIAAAVKIIDNEQAQDANKLKAAALIISTYKDLIKDVYSQNYDEDEAVPMQEENKGPVFSLRMINNENKEQE